MTENWPHFFKDKVIKLRTYMAQTLNITQEKMKNMTQINKSSMSCLEGAGNTGL